MGSGLGSGLGLGLGLESVFAFDSKRENRDTAVETVESVSQAVGSGLGLGSGLNLHFAVLVAVLQSTSVHLLSQLGLGYG